MFEAFFLAALVTVVVVAIRGRKTPVFENPIIIHKVGIYHATLSPQLAHAGNFIERIASEFAEAHLSASEITTQYFEIREKAADAFYLLAVGARAGVLYFQAITPMPLLTKNDSHYKILRQFSEQVMVHHPLVSTPDSLCTTYLQDTVKSAANSLQIICNRLLETDQ